MKRTSTSKAGLYKIRIFAVKINSKYLSIRLQIIPESSKLFWLVIYDNWKPHLYLIAEAGLIWGSLQIYFLFGWIFIVHKVQSSLQNK